MKKGGALLGRRFLASGREENSKIRGEMPLILLEGVFGRAAGKEGGKKGCM